MKEYSGGTSGVTPSFPPLDLYNDKGGPNLNAVASYVVHKGEPVNIPDVYLDDTPLSEGSKKMEKISGYRTNSMLVVPMKDHKDEVIGVLQLLNAQDEKGLIVPFEEEFNEIIQSLGSQAAVALDTVELIDEINKLLDSIIKYTVNAIDERSPHTAGHSSRVAKFTRKIAETINKQEKGPFKDINFSDEELKEIWVSGLMHDVGKIGVPEAVLEKQNRLDGANFQVVLDRYARIRDTFIFKSKIRNIKNNKNEDYIDKELKSELEEWESEFDFLNWLNKPGYLPDDKKEFLDLIANKKYLDSSGNEHKYLTEEEHQALSVRKGNLTDSERKVIQGHILGTKKLLSKLPFPKKWKNVPFYASSHHEWVNGKGYPDGLKGDEIPLPARIMCIADVWDAVTAQDRPYKPPHSPDKACEILETGAKFGEFDKDVVDLFISKRLWKKK
jgi:HD-GYP domain-containing protein (c-di-GMP phosphodiesterase class II)